MRAAWPKPLGADFHAHYGLLPEDETRANAKFDVVLAGRGLRRDFNIASNKKITFVLKAQNPLSDDDRSVIQLSLNAEALDIVDSNWTPPRGTPQV